MTLPLDNLRHTGRYVIPPVVVWLDYYRHPDVSVHWTWLIPSFRYKTKMKPAARCIQWYSTGGVEIGYPRVVRMSDPVMERRNGLRLPLKKSSYNGRRSRETLGQRQRRD
jgi:hypothetical protein